MKIKNRIKRHIIILSILFIFITILLFIFFTNITNNLLYTLSHIKYFIINNTIFKYIYYNDIEIKNMEFEKSNINTDIVQKRINEINKTNQTLFNESNISNEYYKENKIKDIDVTLFLSFSINENNITEFIRSKNPKISIIIPIFNSEIYLLNIQYCIQSQSLKDLEIIYIDDCSTDNSTQLIQKLQEKDKRIILLKNKKNRGEFYSRNKAAMFCRGEYIQFIDSDDIIIYNILEKAYITAKLRNVDVVQYGVVLPDRRKKFYLVEEITKNGVINQPELSDQMYYGRGKLKQDNFYIFNKIIKTEIFLKSLIFIGDEYLKENIYINEDLLQLFSILRVANSLLFIKDIGYIKMFYDNKNTQTSLTNSSEFANRVFHDNILEVKFLFERSQNNSHDKAICMDFLRISKDLYSSIMKNVNRGYEFFDEVFNLLLNSEYYTSEQKDKTQIYKNQIFINYKSNTVINN